MYITERQWPALGFLKTGIQGVIKVDLQDSLFFNNPEYRKIYKEVFNNNKQYFNQNVYYISEPFAEACIKNIDSLLGLYGDIIQEEIVDFEVNGTYIIGNKIIMLHHTVKKDQDVPTIIVYIFHKTGVPLAMTESIVDNSFSWLSNSVKIHTEIVGQMPQLTVYNVGLVIVFDMFKRYASVETKFVKNRSVLKSDSKKYVNQTDLDITYLDSTWFTTLVKSSEFGVKGHLRLQPKKKDGVWTKELIWINDFKKKGYSRQAKILTDK